MRKFPVVRALNALLPGAVFLLTACDAPESTTSSAETEASLLAAPSLVSCPTGETRGAKARILPPGGTLGLGRNAVVVPGAALLGAVEIGITVPASAYMLVELRANGQDHWQFQAPLTVTIDYSRCPIGPLDPPVTVWHVEPATGALLEHMGGVDSRATQTITFTTDHFSGYAIAN